MRMLSLFGHGRAFLGWAVPLDGRLRQPSGQSPLRLAEPSTTAPSHLELAGDVEVDEVDQEHP
jgi:hypothetical protein